MSNDSWFPDARGPRLHLISAAFRSLETGLPQVRVTNSGISALILPTGDLRQATAFDARAAERVAVPRVRAGAPFAALGPVAGPGQVGLAAALLLWALARAVGRPRG
jgi:apolipoprotein N-acyltransferase